MNDSPEQEPRSIDEDQAAELPPGYDATGIGAIDDALWVPFKEDLVVLIQRLTTLAPHFLPLLGDPNFRGTTSDMIENDTLEQELRIIDNGQVVVTVGLLATFYFEGAHQAEVRKRVADCFEEYQALCGEYLRWGRHVRGEKSSKWHKCKSSRILFPQDLFEGLGEEFPWEFEFHGGETPESANEFSIEAFGSPSWDRFQRLSYLRMTLPAKWTEERQDEVLSLVMSFCQNLQPLHGYSGLGIITSPDIAIQQEFQPVVFGIAQRFPGFEVDNPASHSLYLEKGIKSVNWLTILHERWLSLVPGLSELRENYQDFSFLEYPGGLLIQAGSQPARRYPELYVKLSQLLKPIRVTELPSFWDEEAGKKWFTRFD